MLEIEIEGAGAGEYDVLNVTGTATLDGVLHLLFPGAYQGAKQDSFQIVTAGAISGKFVTLDQPVGMGATPSTVRRR